MAVVEQVEEQWQENPAHRLPPWPGRGIVTKFSVTAVREGFVDGILVDKTEHMHADGGLDEDLIDSDYLLPLWWTFYDCYKGDIPDALSRFVIALNQTDDYRSSEVAQMVLLAYKIRGMRKKKRKRPEVKLSALLRMTIRDIKRAIDKAVRDAEEPVDLAQQLLRIIADIGEP